MERIAPGIHLVPVRTPTLPPATHTNTWIVGEGELTVVDPASPWEDEQRRLHAALEARVRRGERIARIVLTHHHGDHVAGAVALREHFDSNPPIAAHPETAALLDFAIDEGLSEGQVLVCGGRELTVRHTPGHAPGHVVLHDTRSGAMVAGDMVAGIGTILIEPGDGDLGSYLDSLERMRSWGPQRLLPAHGPVLEHADTVLAFYIAHRHQRTDLIRRALERAGTATALQLAATVYAGQVPDEAMPLAAAQVTSHLLWMQRHGLARSLDGGCWSRA